MIFEYVANFSRNVEIFYNPIAISKFVKKILLKIK